MNVHALYSSQHHQSKPHHDSILHLSPNVNSPTTCTLSATPSHLSTNSTLTPIIVQSSIGSPASTSGIVKSIVSEKASDELTSATSDVYKYDSALQDLRRRRLELKQQ